MSAPRPHLSHHVATVWRRRKLFLAVCLAVGATVLTRALFLPPTYRSHALIQVESDEMGGLLGELKALESSTNAETEMEIMRSFRVAEDAFGRLTPADFLDQEHAYRPFDRLVSRMSGAAACRMSVDVERLPAGAPPESFVFDFTGPRLVVEHRVADGDVREVSVPGFEIGRPFRVGDREFVLRSADEYAGRRFRLVLRSPVDGARWIRKHVRVLELGRRTGVVRLEFEARTPALCRRVAAALAESYLELKQEQRREKLVHALAFLDEQTGRVRDRLKAAEDELDRFRVDSGVLMLSERARWLVERAAALELEDAELELKARELTRLREGLAGDDGLVVALRALGDVDPISRSLAESLVRLETTREAFEQEGLKAAHPKRAAVEQEIGHVRKRLAEGLSSGLDSRIGALKRRRTELSDWRTSLENETRKLPQTERTAAKLTRAVAANLKIFNLLVEQKQEAQVALASTLSTARLIDRPLEPVERSSPLLLLQAIVAAVLALATGAGAVAFAEYMDRTVKSAKNLEEATGLPLFAAIPAFGSLRRAALRGMKGDLVVQHRPHAIPSESYRALRTNLGYARLERPLRTLAITSAAQGEGKTATACNLAVACAQAGERTLLLDADMRRPATHTRFAHSQAPGLAEVLAGECEWRDVCRQTTTNELHAIPAGATPGDPCTLLASSAFTELLGKLGESYDTIIVDAPPVLAVADTGALLPAVDGVLLLARYGRHPVEVVLEARDRVQRAGTELLGVIFNALDLRAMPRQSYGAYGAYGGYGEEAEPRRAEPAPSRSKVNA